MIRVLDDHEAASRAAAEEIAALAVEAVGATGRFTVALAGGGTPRRLYELLATELSGAVPWEHVHVFWGDERCVPPDDRDSNYRMARETLLDHVPVPAPSIHRIRGELGPEPAASAYDGELAAFFGRAASAAPFGVSGGVGPPPGLDLALLGLGEDGHTASLFPGGVAPDDSRWARPATAPAGARTRDRVTLTLKALNASDRVLFLVTGAGKREALARARGPDDDAPPAALVRGRVATLWYVDRAAGS